MRASTEISIDLTADELLSPLPPVSANVVARLAEPATADDEDTVEIELTAAQMDALLSGKSAAPTYSACPDTCASTR